ncbi:hypothetical protein, partial [Brachyspira hampsonii]
MLSEERKKELKNLVKNKLKIFLNDYCFIGGMSLEYLGGRKAVEIKFDMFIKYKPIVKVIWIEIPFPKYRKKDINNHDISTKVERIKKLVRDEFKDKIDGYFHDVIIHIGDNFEHNRIINKGPDQTRPDQT